MADQENQQDGKYHKRIDELIDDAEIEAEIEAEKKIRSKNTKLLTISLVGVALIFFIYMQVKDSMQSTTSEERVELPLAELAKNRLEPKINPPEEPTVDADIDDKAAPSSLDTLEAKIKAMQEELMKNPSMENPAIAAALDPENDDKQAPDIEKKASQKIAAATPQKKQPSAKVSKKSPPVEKTKPTIKSTPIQNKPKALPAKQRSRPGKKYFVQTGVFSVKQNAENLFKKLKNKGFSPSIQIKNIESMRHIVFVGGFTDELGSRTQMEELRDQGFKPEPAKNGDKSHMLILGKFKTSDQANLLRDELSLKGYLSSSKKAPIRTEIYVVQLGAFDSIDLARQTKKSIEKSGFRSSFIR